MGTNYAGIDYGMGRSNIDPKTGIRYGVISSNEVLQAWADSSEPVYLYSCPKCEMELGNELFGKCPHCGYEFEDDDFEFCEPINFSVEDDEYVADCGEDGDIFITKSPYFTFAQFCSPCAPGAGYLMNPFKPEGEAKAQLTLVSHISPKAYGEAFRSYAEAAGFPRVYCFGHDWFEDEKTGNVVECEYCKGTGLRVKKEIPDFNEKLFVENGGKVHDDHHVGCWVCKGTGKKDELVSKAPYPVFSVETGELVQPTE